MNVRMLCNADLLALAGSSSDAKAEVARRQVWDENLNDQIIDLYHDGMVERWARRPRPACPFMADGWNDANRDAGVRVVAPARPEGYYHAPVGTFD